MNGAFHTGEICEFLHCNFRGSGFSCFGLKHKCQGGRIIFNLNKRRQMTSFNIINNSEEIMLSSQWIPSAKFNSKDRIVDAEGKTVSSDYKGRQYRIIEKRERIFSTSECIGRGFIGTLAVVCTLFLGLFFSKFVQNLFIKKKENKRFGVLVSPFLVQLKKREEEQRRSEKELQQGMSISEETVTQIQRCMKNLLQSKKEDGVKLYKCQGNRRVFALDTAPAVIFKMKAYKSCSTVGRDDSMKARYQTMLNAQTVVRTQQLGLLIIPHAKLFNVNAENEKYEIIVEQKLDINSFESAQEQYFEDYADSLNEAIRQLAVFVFETGYNDVEWRNNPILNNSLDANGNRKIALIDIEEMGDARIGLIGGSWGRRGLVRCVNEKQGKIVETVAKEHNIGADFFAEARAQRKEELAEGRKLKKYHETKNIVKGNESVQVDESTLDFAAYADSDKAKQLKTVTIDLVKAINEKILTNSPDESVKGRRYIYIDTQSGFFYEMGKKLIDPVKIRFKTIEECCNATFLGQAVKKLVDLGVIFKLVKCDCRGYCIQA
jgi:hypothetical protein